MTVRHLSLHQTNLINKNIPQLLLLQVVSFKLIIIVNLLHILLLELRSHTSERVSMTAREAVSGTHSVLPRLA